MSNCITKNIGQPNDVTEMFVDGNNDFFVSAKIAEFDAAKAEGTIDWKEYFRKTCITGTLYVPRFIESELLGLGSQTQQLPFSVEFVTPKTLRLSFCAAHKDKPSIPNLMIPGELPKDNSWKCEETEGGVIYRSAFGSLEISYDPMKLTLKDASGKVLTKSYHLHDNTSLVNTDATPLSFVRTAKEQTRNLAASFTLAPGERIYGCGESFTGLNKRGQKVELWTIDAAGVESDRMYKPVPFYMSSRGYGVFVHTTRPMTLDFGHTFDGIQTIYSNEDVLDMFVFLGSPQEILTEYTALTGRSPMPPLWTFGLWMSRITYKSEAEARHVAEKLRELQIPCDVIHLDTGWFERDWQCDYKFSTTRFDDPKKMLDDFKDMGYRVSLWQMPYFTRGNALYEEMAEKGYFIHQTDGTNPTEDAILDMSNPEAVEWYKGLLKNLIDEGVSAIKVDFGEGSPLYGKYASGNDGLTEHNFYPLRYNKIVYDLTKELTGEGIIWARSAWAGSQRYPVHWGGDAQITDDAMLATLRGGLSLGLCGFSFWSHDIGGFSMQSPRELYTRWLPFGMLSSHSRCHGVPPTEPWEYDDAFVDEFRKAVEMKYQMMPYVIAQAEESSEKGYPMVRTLFFEFPQDDTAWFIEDEYMFGSDMLVAPLFEENTLKRRVYVPEGSDYVDYQTGKEYAGGRWYEIEAGEIPIIVLVKKGVEIKKIPVVQHTGEIDPAVFEK